MGEGGPNPPKNHKFIGFPSNTGTHPLKITKLPSQHSMWSIIGPPAEMPFQLCFAGRPIVARFWLFFGASLPSKKKPIRVGPPLTKLYDKTSVFQNFTFFF